MKTDLKEVQNILETQHGVSILADLCNHELKNNKFTRLFDTSKKTSEVFYLHDKHGNVKPHIYDFKNGVAWFPITAYMQVYGLTRKEAFIELGTKYDLLKPKKNAPKQERTYKPQIIASEKEQNTTCTQKKDYSITNTEITQKGLEYFAQFGISKEYLDKCKVKSVDNLQKVDTETGKLTTISHQNNLTFSFELCENVFKIYQPTNQKYKWLWCILDNAEKPKEAIYFLDCLPLKCDIILIVEGLKDCLAVNNNFNQFGIYAVGLDSANVQISQNTLKKLNKASKNVFLCLDNDKTGKEQNRLKSVNLGLKALYYPNDFKGKDFADLLANNTSKEKIKEWITNAQEHTQNHTNTQEKVQNNNFKTSELLQKALNFKIDLNKEITETFCFTYTDDLGETYNLGSFGNLIFFSGKAKSRKTTFVSALLSSAFSNSDVLGFSFDLPQNSNVVYFDTEQSEFDAQKTIKRIFEQNGLNGNDFNNFEAFQLRQFSIKERFEIIKEYLEYKKPKLVVLDGIADLILNNNDIAETNTLLQELIKIIDKYECLFITIVHENKGNGFATGHLGSFLEKKSQCHISIEKDPSNSLISNVLPKLVRSSKDNFGLSFGIENNKVVFQNSPKNNKTDKLLAQIKEVFEACNAKQLNSNDFKNCFANKFGVGTETTKKEISKAIKLKYIESIGNTKNTIYKLLV